MEASMRINRHPGPFGMWVGHYALRLLIPIFVLSAISDVTTSLLTMVLALVALLSLAVVAFCIMAHERTLCVRCVHDVPAHDPQGAVARHERTLRAFHHTDWLFAAVLAIGITMMLIPRGIENFVWSIPLYGLVAGIGHIERVHNQLQPWCPACPRPNSGT